MIRANDPNLHSWIQISPTSDFPIQNLPFGIFSTETHDPRVGVAIGEYVLDLCAVSQHGLFDLLSLEDHTIFQAETLNRFIALGKPVWREVRERVSELLRNNNPELRDNDQLMKACLVKKQAVTMHLPVNIPNYTNFNASIDHATNIGMLLPDSSNALFPNWKHLPVGYYNRASSIKVSGQPIFRPQGPLIDSETGFPAFKPTQELDFELEIAFITGRATDLGSYVLTDEADDYIFGLVLLNNWSARDILRWENAASSPFLGKSFASSVSPWVVTLDALEPFRLPGPIQEHKVLPHLQYDGQKHLDISLKVYLQPENGESLLVCRTNTRNLYWNLNQLLAHQTSNGCNIQIGDLYASGAISGSEPDSFGSLLELTWHGAKPLTLPNGAIRQYLQNGDSILIKGYAERNNIRIGFGELCTKIFPTL